MQREPGERLQRSTALVKGSIALARPPHWLKNGAVFAAPFFTGDLTSADVWARNSAVLGVWCLASAAIYAFNDVSDEESDRAAVAADPDDYRRNRPLVTGWLTRRQAQVIGTLELGAALICGALVGVGTLLIVAIYISINLARSIAIQSDRWIHKDHPLDWMLVSAGFGLRVLSGVTGTSPRPRTLWIYPAVLGGAIVVSISKRMSKEFRRRARDTVTPQLKRNKMHRLRDWLVASATLSAMSLGALNLRIKVDWYDFSWLAFGTLCFSIGLYGCAPFRRAGMPAAAIDAPVIASRSAFAAAIDKLAFGRPAEDAEADSVKAMLQLPVVVPMALCFASYAAAIYVFPRFR